MAAKLLTQIFKSTVETWQVETKFQWHGSYKRGLSV